MHRARRRRERTGERSIATVPQVHALAEAVPPRCRMLIQLAAWSGARRGELVALGRDWLDLEHGTMTIDRQYVEPRDGTLVLDTPKSAAGVRTVHIPPHLLPELVQHLERYTTSRSPGVFPNSKDQPIRRASFRSVWLLARRRAGLPELRFHDLRHTGNTLAAATGPSTKEQGAHGPRLHARRADLPARHHRPRCSHRFSAVPARPRRDRDD